MWILYFASLAMGKPITTPQLFAVCWTNNTGSIATRLPPSQMPSTTARHWRDDAGAISTLMSAGVVSVATVELSSFGITLDGDFVLPFENGRLSLANWHKLKKVGQRYQKRVKWKRELLRQCGVNGELDQRLLIADPSLPVETIVTVLGLLETSEDSPLGLVPSRASTSNSLHEGRTYTTAPSPA